MATQLTETAIARVVREATAEGGVRQDLRDPAHPGLWLRIGTTGRKTWALRARDRAGKPHWFTLGQHPAIGLADARRAADAMRVAVRNGANPIAEGRAERTEAQQQEQLGVATLKSVLALYAAQCELSSWPHSRKRIDRVFATLLARPVGQLTTRDLQRAADDYPARQSAGFAVRTLRPVLRWAARRGDVPRELAAGLVEPVPVRQRKRRLSRTELGALLPVLDPEEGAHAAAARWICLTLARLREATQARWRDIDFAAKTWTIPETKNGEPHVLPLSRQAIALLDTLPEGKPDDLIFANREGAELGNWDRVWKRLLLLSGLARQAPKGPVLMKDASSLPHRHDLRRTAATLLGEMGIEPHVIEAALNHVAIHSPLAATYNRSRYRPQVAEALQRLADLLEGIERGGAEIVPLASADVG